MDVSDAPPDVDPDNIAELSTKPDVWYTAHKPTALAKKHSALGRARRDALARLVEGTKKKKMKAVDVGAPRASKGEDMEGEGNWSDHPGRGQLSHATNQVVILTLTHSLTRSLTHSLTN